MQRSRCYIFGFITCKSDSTREAKASLQGITDIVHTNSSGSVVQVLVEAKGFRYISAVKVAVYNTADNAAFKQQDRYLAAMSADSLCSYLSICSTDNCCTEKVGIPGIGAFKIVSISHRAKCACNGCTSILLTWDCS